MDRSRSVSRSASRPRKSTDARSPSPMYTYMSARSHSPSRGRPSSSSSSSHPRSHAASRSRSRPQPRSRSSSRSATSRPHHHHQHKHQHQHEHSTTTAHPHGLFKNTAGLLAGIGLATIIAHKAWPKGILHGDADEWESRPQPTTRRASESHRRHSHSHHRRPSDAAERTVERAKNLRGRGDLVYYEEIVPVRKGEPRRRDLEKRGFERERAPAKGPARLPYPEHAFPDERFYEPSVGRARAVENVYR